MTRVIVEIKGGLCMGVYSDGDVDVEVLDRDNMEQAQGQENQEEYEGYKELDTDLQCGIKNGTYHCVW